MTPLRHLDDTVNRKVLLALELVDPVTLALVYRGVQVRAAGIDGTPRVSLSGRFVWLDQGGAWPSGIEIDLGRLPYAPAPAIAPAAPVDPAHPTDEERRVRVVLNPSRAYPFGDGVTALRGTLRRSVAHDAPGLDDAAIALAWRDTTSGDWIVDGLPAHTDANGEFAVFVRLAPVAPARPDLVDGALAVQLQVTRHGEAHATPDDFPFSRDPAVPAGRVREGLPLAEWVALGWTELGGS
jgi:hypothetical protein